MTKQTNTQPDDENINEEKLYKCTHQKFEHLRQENNDIDSCCELLLHIIKNEPDYQSHIWNWLIFI